ncbi:MAG: AgmX/PglI C-terminal domain-containing protein [Deltaproteobacteria bacterium]|nr:AgmX/PglI C-terminal domain-containing protein [Deltaproteobacteria bacterium]
MVTTQLQVVCSWQRRLLGYHLLGPKGSFSAGPSKRAQLKCPQFIGARKRLVIVRPGRNGYRLRLAPGMTGYVEQPGEGRQDITQLLAQPIKGKSPLRTVPFAVGAAAVIQIDGAAGLKLQLSFVEPPPAVGKRTSDDRLPFYRRVLLATSVSLAVLVAALVIWGPRTDQDENITQERFAKLVEPELQKPETKQARDDVKKHGEKKKRDKEAAESKRAKDKEGKLGRQDAKGETVMPKGNKDVLREKVSQVGVLSLLGKAKAGGSGLGKLLAEANPTDMEQAVTGLTGGQVAVGKGSGGLGAAGTGLGGGGTGFGHIQGSGGLDVGAGRGHGRKGPGLGTGKEKTVSVGLSTGDPDADGGLTKEQISRVVSAHKAALKYCYEKELQRKPSLEGKVELYWMIRATGEVERVKIATSTMGDAEVEACMQRQVKNWQFPKATAPTIVQRYPFLFKGGA